MHDSQIEIDIINILNENKIENYQVQENSKGYDHRIYLVFSDTGNYCIRIPINEKNKLIAQSWAFNEWNKLGVPVPKIIKVTDDYLIEELIEGKDIDESELATNQLEQILFELGKHTKVMHTVKTTGFGYIKIPGIGSKESWREFLEPDFKGTLIDNVKHNILSIHDSQIAEELFDQFSNYLDIEFPRLIHADLKQDNIMILDGKLSGIIDASDAMSGDVYYDLAVIRYCFGQLLFNAFLNGYGKIDLCRLNFYLLYYSNWLIAFYGRISKDDIKFKIAQDNFQQTIEFLKCPTTLQQ